MISCAGDACDDLFQVVLIAALAALVLAALLASMFIVGVWYLLSTRLARRGMTPLPRNAVGVAAGAVPVVTAVLLARSGVYASDAVLASLVVLPIVVASAAALQALRVRRARLRADRPATHPPA